MIELVGYFGVVSGIACVVATSVGTVFFDLELEWLFYPWAIVSLLAISVAGAFMGAHVAAVAGGIACGYYAREYLDLIRDDNEMALSADELADR